MLSIIFDMVPIMIDTYDTLQKCKKQPSDSLLEKIRLINEGHDINELDCNGKAVLHYAADEGNLDIVKCLIENGADFNKEMAQKYTLERFGINGERTYTLTPLHCAARNGHLDIVKFLIEKGADFNKQDNKGKAALHYAADCNHLDVVKFLIAKGADFTQQDKRGETALHSAAHSRHSDVVKFLIENGADFNKQDYNGDTAINYCSRLGQWDIVKFLIEKGADFNKQDMLGSTALYYAADRNRLDIVKFLIAKGADIIGNGKDALHCAARNGHLDIVKFLIAKGADINQQDDNGDTLLHCAARNGHLDIVKFLTAKGADINQQDDNGDTLLHCAARNGHLDIVKFLIDSPSFNWFIGKPSKNSLLINSCNNEGHSVGNYYTHDPKMQKYLFEHGLIPIKDKDRTLVKIAQSKQSVHETPMVKMGCFVTNLIVEVTSKAADHKQSLEAAYNFRQTITKLFNDDLSIKLLPLSNTEIQSILQNQPLAEGSNEQEKRKAIVSYILTQAEHALQTKYLKESHEDKDDDYRGHISILPIQYDWSVEQGKYITIPELIGRVVMLIDKLEMTDTNKKELLVSLIELKNSTNELEQYLDTIKSILGDDKIELDQLSNKTKCYQLLNALSNKNNGRDKVTELFNHISNGLDIKEIWQEQQKFMLVQGIYRAATTYGEDQSACLVGIWQQIILSSIEINNTFNEAYGDHNNKELAKPATDSSISQQSIKQFATFLAEELIELVTNNEKELKDALYDLSIGMLDINRPNSISLNQQRILVAINSAFTRKIKDYLPNHDGNIPTAESYKILIDAMMASETMQKFGRSCMSQDSEEGNGMNEIVGSGTNLFESESYWNEYSLNAMKNILELRLKSLGLDIKDARVVHPKCVFNDKTIQNFIQDLAAQIRTTGLAVDSRNITGLKLLIPVNLDGKHWVGMTVEFSDGKIKLTYMDSEGNAMPTSLSEGLTAELGRSYPDTDIEITEQVVEHQNSNNCGLHVIENLIAAVAGEVARIGQEDALEAHSVLYEQSLILEETWREKVLQEEQAKHEHVAGSKVSNKFAESPKTIEVAKETKVESINVIAPNNSVITDTTLDLSKMSMDEEWENAQRPNAQDMVAQIMDQVCEDTQNSNTNELNQRLAMAKEKDSKAALESMDDAWSQTNTAGSIQKLPKITDPKVVKEISILTVQSNDQPIEQQPVELKKSHIGQQTQVAPSYGVPKVLTGMGETLWNSAVQCLHTLVQVNPYDALDVMRSGLQAEGCDVPSISNRYDATKQSALLLFSNLLDEAQSDGQRNAASFDLKPLDNTLSDIQLSAFGSMAGTNIIGES